jgi:hypothetical protein
MITYCQNPVKLVALLPDGLQPDSSSSDPMKRIVITYNYKTGQVLPVSLDKLECQYQSELDHQIHTLEDDYFFYQNYMQLNS